MHVPSPSDYVPLDSDAPSFFQQSKIQVPINLAVVTVVLYDHLITLDIEVERIWTLKWGLPKILFFTSRYVVPPLLMITVIGNTGYPLLFSFCNFDNHFYQLIQCLSLFIADIVLLIRVSALYGYNKIIQWFLICLFICQLVAVIVEVAVLQKLVNSVLSYEFLPGCSSDTGSTRSDERWHYSWPVPFISFEGILLVLTLVKAFPYRNNPMITLLARDSIFYFALMFASLLENILVLTPTVEVDVFVPMEWIACIAVSRMMLNIRGLTLNEPLGSQGLHLSTMVFQKRDDTESSNDSEGASTVQDPLGVVENILYIP